MKFTHLFSVFAMFAMIISSGCAKTTADVNGENNTVVSTTEQPKAEISKSTNQPASAVSTTEVKSIEVDKGILNVKVTLPATMFNGANLDEVISKAKSDGVDEVVKNDDGSLTYKMSKAKHSEMLKQMEASILKSNDDMKNSGNFKSIKDITTNKSFSEYTITVDQAAFKNSMDGMVGLGVAMTGMYYQLFNGASADNYKVTISLKDVATGVVFDTIVYPDVLKKK